jgi:arylsulfatase A-like enzyme
MLDSTLVCVTSEFGRSPKINARAGRDHWPKVFSNLLAGGGIRQGQVFGSSNATASEPADNPLSVEDWATTIYHCLGIDAGKELMAPGGRPIEIVKGGNVQSDLLV